MRKIIHIDMDAFFASVEQRDHPELRGRALVVGGNPARRGVVCSASYEARKFGVRSAMSSAKAAELCPHAIFVPVRMDAYRDVSIEIMKIFAEYAENVEAVSIDEAYLDVTTNLKDLPYARDVAKAIRADVFGRTGLTASAGVAPNKFLAKIASDMNKPDGLTIIAPEMVAILLEAMPVRRLPGVGPATEAKLRTIGVETTRDIRAMAPEIFIERFGRYGSRLLEFAMGIDERTVKADRIRKSVGVERTFSQDLRSAEEAKANLAQLADKLCERLGSKSGMTLTLKVKFSDFRIITRAQSADTPFCDRDVILATAQRLLALCVDHRTPIRLLGLSVSHLRGPGCEQEQAARREQLVFAFGESWR